MLLSLHKQTAIHITTWIRQSKGLVGKLDHPREGKQNSEYHGWEMGEAWHGKIKQGEWKGR